MSTPVTPPPAGAPLLEVQHLVVEYLTPRGPARAVDDVNFILRQGEVFGLAGESGCGKSTVAHAILRLIKEPGRISGGQIRFAGQNLNDLSPTQLQQFRWRRASIVFQSAMNALNPVMTLGDQIIDAILAHERLHKKAALARAADLFTLVGIEPRRLRSFPHELSGGMRQRAVIAMALALQPELVILDEPTTALDVVVQRDILQQIQDLQARFGFSILFITHDLSLLVEFSTRIAIMYAGRIIDLAPARDLFEHPRHPYTVGLMNSFPSIHGDRRALQGIPGTPPDLVSPPAGCRFAPRCPRVMARCTVDDPPLRAVAPDYLTACHLYDPDLAAQARPEEEEVAHGRR